MTADNWFSSVDTIEKLGKRKVTYVGTLRKDKSATSNEFLPKNDLPVVSTFYGFKNNNTSFVCPKIE